MSAQRPLILAGGGVRIARAYDELRGLAEQLDVPVYTSFMGKSALPSDHRLNLGVAGVWGEYPATEAVRNADVILAVGARFNDLHTGSWLKGYVYNIPPTRLIQVDIDPEEIGRNYPVEIGMVGDAKAFLAQAARIARAKGARMSYGGTWHKEIDGWRADWRNFCEPFERSSEVPIEPRRIMAEMNRISPPDTVMVDDVGNCQVWSEQYWQPKTAGNHLTAGGFAAMGFGVAGVMGARLARPNSPCVTLCGDGGFMMMPHVIATSVEYNLPAVWVLQNNYAIGTIRDLQRAYHDGREIGTSFVNERTGKPGIRTFPGWPRQWAVGAFASSTLTSSATLIAKRSARPSRPSSTSSSTATPGCRSPAPGRCRPFQKCSRPSASARCADRRMNLRRTIRSVTAAPPPSRPARKARCDRVEASRRARREAPRQEFLPAAGRPSRVRGHRRFSLLTGRIARRSA